MNTHLRLFPQGSPPARRRANFTLYLPGDVLEDRHGNKRYLCTGVDWETGHVFAQLVQQRDARGEWRDPAGKRARLDYHWALRSSRARFVVVGEATATQGLTAARAGAMLSFFRAVFAAVPPELELPLGEAMRPPERLGPYEYKLRWPLPTPLSK